jgi:hypothetical protein
VLFRFTIRRLRRLIELNRTGYLAKRDHSGNWVLGSSGTENSLKVGEHSIPGSSGPLVSVGLGVRPKGRVPPPKGLLPLFIQHPRAYLQKQMGTTLGPLHCIC